MSNSSSIKNLFNKYKFKFIAWDNLPIDTIEPKIMHANTRLGYHIKLFYLKCFYDYIEVDMVKRE